MMPPPLTPADQAEALALLREFVAPWKSVDDDWIKENCFVSDAARILRARALLAKIEGETR